MPKRPLKCSHRQIFTLSLYCPIIKILWYVFPTRNVLGSLDNEVNMQSGFSGSH